MDTALNEFSYQILGRHMRTARKHCGLTQAQIAEIMGVSTHYYNSLERGKERISFLRFVQFLVITKASASDLLAGCQKEIASSCNPSPNWSEARREMEMLLDQSSEESIQAFLEFCTLLSTRLR